MKNLLLITFVFSCTLLFSQTYDLTVRQGTYEPLEKSISLTNNEVWDDPDYLVPIGFTFTFFDDNIDQFYSNMNESNVLFTEPEETYDEVPFSALIPLLADLIDLGYNTGESLSNISYLLEGEEGSRICKIEWSNAGFFENSYYSTSNDFVNFQLWLYEEAGTIELHFGDSEISNLLEVFPGGGPTVGMLGGFDNTSDSTTVFSEFLVLEGDPANPSVVYLDPDGYEYFYDENTLDSMPASGTIYSFNRMSVSTDEIRKFSTRFSVQPNPAQNIISLRSEVDFSKIHSVSIFNSNGSLMGNIQSNYDNMNIADLNSGIYNLKIFTNDGIAVKRFVKIE